MLEIGDDLIIIDHGAGVHHRFIEAGYRVRDVTHFFMTHCHLDPIADFPRLALTRWDHGPATHQMVDGYLSATTGASLRHDEIAMDLAFLIYTPEFDKRLYSQFGSDVPGTTKNNWAQLRVCMGEHESAFQAVRGIENHNGVKSNKYRHAFTLARLAILHQIAKTNECEALAMQGIDIAETCDLTMTNGFANCALGGHLLEKKQPKAALERLEKGVSLLEQSSTGVFVAYYKCLLAKCLAEVGQLESASREMKAAAALINKGADGWAYSDANRIIYEFEYTYLNGRKKSITKLEKIHRSSTANGSLLWSLRLSITLARMYSAENQFSKAVEFLQREIPKFPTSGRNSKDFQQAFNLLALCSGDK